MTTDLFEYVRVADPHTAGWYVTAQAVDVQPQGVTTTPVPGAGTFFTWDQLHPVDRGYYEGKAAERFVRTFYDYWNAGDLEAVTRLIHPEYVDHIDFGGVRTSYGREGFLSDRQQGAKALTGTHIVIQSLVGQGDRAMARVDVHATQVGPYKGLGKAGDAFMMHAISEFRLVDGLLKEHWEQAAVIAMT